MPGEQQFEVTWPDEPVVALAYLDQIVRGGGMAPEDEAALRDALEAAKAADGRDRDLARDLRAMAKGLMEGAGEAGGKTAMLADTMEGVAKSLR